MEIEKSSANELIRKPRYIFVNGPAGSGKDHCVNALYMMLEVIPATYAVRMKFAAPLKSAVAQAFNLSPPQISYLFETPAKNEPSELFYGRTPREVLIAYSEQFMKPLFGAAIFGKLAYKMTSYLAGLSTFPSWFLFSDSGFQAEFDVIYDQVGPENVFVLRLSRPGYSFAGDSRSYINPRKAFMFDLVNDGTVGDLELRLSKLLQTIVEVYGE